MATVEYDSLRIAENIIPRSYLLALIKHPSFAEECEWRMIASPRRTGAIALEPKNLKLRESRNMMVPYLNLEIPCLTGSTQISGGRTVTFNESHPGLHINEVIVGPTAHRTLALSACNILLPPYLRMYPTVSSSSIPYRNW